MKKKLNKLVRIPETPGKFGARWDFMGETEGYGCKLWALWESQVIFRNYCDKMPNVFISVFPNELNFSNYKKCSTDFNSFEKYSFEILCNIERLVWHT